MAFAVGDYLYLTGLMPTWPLDASRNSKAPFDIPTFIKITAVRRTGYDYVIAQGGPMLRGSRPNTFASEDSSDPLLTNWTFTNRRP